MYLVFCSEIICFHFLFNFLTILNDETTIIDKGGWYCGKSNSMLSVDPRFTDKFFFGESIAKKAYLTKFTCF